MVGRRVRIHDEMEPAMTVPYSDLELQPTRYGEDYSNPGERCPVTDPFWCSRDRYHPGAHVSRSEKGPGMIGWPNTTEPFVRLDPYRMGNPIRRGRSGAVLVYVFAALVVVGVVVWWWVR